ncbi:hypothetical protein QBC38DRAFT_280556 [Podospora fimiseda]|uniref:Uncharacterized protein n=1 Tax=Podospora fimiseda TaxID=252190 RepID=A0AAN7GR45_9PEZI|nr:hypothetical protein QBC38DRAFT_280556 [Podospora fimiseda]
MMFEVDWSDFGSERVGQRRARKGNDHEIKKQESNTITETTSIKTPTPEAKPALSLFGSIGLKRNSLSLRSKKKKDLPSIDVTKEDVKPKRRSLLSPRSATASTFSGTARSSILSNNSFTLPTTGPNEFSHGIPVKWEDPADRSSKESMMSKSTCITIPTLGPQSEESTTSQTTLDNKPVQSLDDASSCVMQKIERTYEENQTSAAADEPVRVATKILAESPNFQATAQSSSPTSTAGSFCIDKSVSNFISDWHKSIYTPHRPISSSTTDQKTQDKSVNEVLIPPNTNSPPQSPATPARSIKKGNYKTMPSPMRGNFRANSGASWKPPDNWKASSPLSGEPQTPKSANPKTTVMSETMYEATLEAMAIQREIKRVGFATPQVILARLTEDWGTAADPIVYKQLETEKKRWMLSAMHRLGKGSRSSFSTPAAATTPSAPSTPCTPCFPDLRGSPGIQVAQSVDGETKSPKPFLGSMKPFLKGPKVLSLYDSQSTTAYLAALHPNNTITHLAPLPLHNLLYPNIRPLYSAVTPSLSFSDNSYISVHSLSMPSLLAGQEVPRLLKGIRRCLASQGTLHMTLIDPSPASRSLGPRMREWLDQNLIINLESEFRCISPSRLFPKWLADARLCGEGSSVTRVKFPAIFHQHPDGSINGSQDGESPIETELQSVVGRMLWQEVWGKAVRGNSWWWEDPECIKECIEHGTFFEYFLIEAVKQD